MTDTADRKTCFLITGLPRSGTSSIAQLLENLGVYFGDSSHFLDTQVHKHNPVFYELQWINDFNDRAIAAMGAEYFDDFFPIERDFGTDGMRALESVLAEQFRGEFGERSLVGVKDPRLCFTLPLWRTMLDRLGYNTRLLLTMRNAAAVIKSNSLLRDDSPPRWQRFYARHLLAINYFARDAKLCQIDFDRLMADPEPAVVELASCIGLSIAEPGAATRHLSAQHYHHRPDNTGTGDKWVDQVDADLRRGALEPQRYLLFRDVASLYAGDARAIATAERQDADRRVAAAVADKDAHILKLVAGKDDHIAKLIADKDGHIAKLESLYRSQSEETDRGYKQLTLSKDQHIEKLEAMVHESAARVLEAEQAIAVHEANHATESSQLRQELAQAQASLANERASLEEARAQIKKAQDELASRQARIGALSAIVDGQRTRLTEVEARLSDLDRQLSELRDRRMVRLMHFMDRVGKRPRSSTPTAAPPGSDGH
jgi:hypothetical protein